MEKDILNAPEREIKKKKVKGFRLLAGCLIFFIAAAALMALFLFAGIKSGFFDGIIRDFAEKMQSASAQNRGNIKPEYADMTAGNLSINQNLPAVSETLAERKSRLEAWHYVYLQRERQYKKYLPEKIADREFGSNAEAAAFLEEEFRKGGYTKSELEAIKNRLDMYSAKIALEKLALEIDKTQKTSQNKEPAGKPAGELEI